MTATARALVILLTLLFSGACSYKVIEDGRLEPAAIVRLIDEVAALRSLPPLRPLKVALESPDQLRQRAKAEAHDPTRIAELHRQHAVWAKLGLIEAEVDLVQAYSAVTTDAPFGYYDPADQTLRIVDRGTMRSEIMETVSALRGRDVVAGEVLAHEVCHALQDMHYDLDGLERAAQSGDASLAMRAVVEGDASLIGFLYSATFFRDFETWVRFLGTRARRLMDVSGVPDYLNARTQFPYIAGGLFVAKVFKASGIPGLSALYEDLPPSTEIIMHPELRGVPAGRPQSVALPDRVEADTHDTVLGEDSLGEFGLRFVLTRNVPGVDARTAARGWGGDRYRVTRTEQGGLGLLWATRWDSDAEASRFCADYAALIQRSYHATAAPSTGSTRRFHKDKALVAAMDCQGAAVDIVESLAPEAINASLRAMIARRSASTSMP